jgi:hypothetical protein
MRNLMRFVAAVCVILACECFSSPAFASDGPGTAASVNFYAPLTDENVYHTGSANNTYVYLQTSDHFVKIYNGQANHTYTVDWQMYLGENVTFTWFDSDTATAGSITTNAQGIGYHYAHDPLGYLNTIAQFYIGSYQAYGTSWISLPGGQPGTANAAAYRTFYVAH